MTTTAKRPSSTTVLLVCGLVAALMVGAAGGAVGASLVTSKQIKDGTIRGVDIRKSTITGAKIKNSSLTGADVKKGSLTGSDLKDGSVTAKDVRSASLTGSQVKDGSLSGADLAVGSVTREQLARDAKPLVAVVGPMGELVRGDSGVEAERLDDGRYEVRFPVTVSSCDYSATIGQTTAINPVLGMIAVAPRSQEPEALLVATTNASGGSQNRGFFLFVYC